MNLTTAEELQNFHRFVGEKLVHNAGQLTPEDVLEEWRELYPGQPECDKPEEVVSAVKKALADMKGGDRGTPAAEVLGELRGKLKKPAM